MGRSYGYNRAENINHYRTSKELVHELIDVVSRGGNLLLNVGPTADGRIPVIMQQRLRDVGSWLQINGEAIYGTRAWVPSGTPSPDGASFSSGGNPEIRFTRKGPDLYAHLLEWPGGEVRIDGLDQTEVLTVELLGFEGPIEWRVDDGSLFFTPPLMSPGEIPSPYAYVFKISAGAPPPSA